MTDQARYSQAAIWLHWLIAAALAFQLGLGLRTEKLAQGEQLFDILQLHKSIGISILLLSILRLIIRFFKPPPPALTDDKAALILSKLVHALLYLFMIGAPLTGWLIVSSSKLEIDTLLFNTVPWPHIPGVETLAGETKMAVHNFAETAHTYMAWLGLSLFLLHIAGALRHQFWKSEPLLARMLPIAAAHKKIAGTMIISSLATIFIAISLIISETGVDPELPVDEAVVAIPKTNPAPISEAEALPETKLASEETEETAPPEVPEPVVEPEKKDIPETRPTQVPNWTVTRKDPIRFSVNRSGSAVQGRFSDWNATIRFAPDALDRSSVEVSVNLTSASTGDSSIDQALSGPDFFATSRFATATIRLDRFRSLGGNRYQGSGTINLRNTSKPVTIPFTLDITGSTANVSGTANISRSAHGVGAGDYADIADNVAVSFSLSARR